MVSRASGVFEVRTSSFPLWVSGRARSISLPLNLARTAALARPGPMDSLTKSPTRMPAGAALLLPSGSYGSTYLLFFNFSFTWKA